MVASNQLGMGSENGCLSYVISSLAKEGVSSQPNASLLDGIPGLADETTVA